MEALVSAAVSAGVSYGLGALFGGGNEDPPPPPYSPKRYDYTTKAPNPLAVPIANEDDHRGLFGLRRIVGRVVASKTTQARTTVVVYLAGDRLTSIDAVYLDNQPVSIRTVPLAGTPIDPPGVVELPWGGALDLQGGTYVPNFGVRLYTGAQIAADPEVASTFEDGANMIGLRCSYAVITIRTDFIPPAFKSLYSDRFPDLTFIVRGFACYDPRDVTQDINDRTTWKFSQNATIIDANYYVHELGMNLPVSSVDWVSVATCASADDVAVALAAGGTEPRYTAALYWSTNERHEDVISRVRAAHDGGLVLIGDKWVARTGVYSVPVRTISTAEYAPGGLRLADSVNFSETFNGVRGKFSSMLHDYEPTDFPQYQDAAALAADGSASFLDLDLSAVTSVSQAQRLARIAYNRLRSGRPATLNVRPANIDLTPVDAIALTDEFADVTGEVFRVMDRRIGEDFDVTLSLLSEPESVYAWNAATDEAPFINTTEPTNVAAISLPGAVAYDSNASATAVTWAFELYPASSDNWDTYEIVAPNGDVYTYSRGAGMVSAVTTYTVTPLSATAQNFTIRVYDSKSDRTSKTVLLNRSANVMNGLTAAGRLVYAMPPPRAPRIQARAGSTVSLRVKAINHPKVSHLLLFWSNSADPVKALDDVRTGASTNYVFLSNTDQIVTGRSAGYYWLAGTTGNVLASVFVPNPTYLTANITNTSPVCPVVI